MSTPTIKVKVFPRPVIKAKMDVRFPGRVDVLSPILLDRTGGNFEFSLDMNAVIASLPPGGVSSVFGRTGDITAEIGDYTFAQIGATPTTLSGYGITDAQPLDADLTAIAALTTAAYGRSLLTLANATALAAEVDSFFLTPAEGNAAYQPLDSDLTAIAALTTTAYGRAFLALADAAAGRAYLGGLREVLTANRTYYVRTDGSNSNDGLSNTSGGAFLTIQKAIDTAAMLDLSVYSVTIQVGNGTYTGANALKSYVGAGPITIVGDETTPANVVINPTASTSFRADGVLGLWNLRGMKIAPTTSGHGIYASGGSKITYRAIDFGSVGVSSHVLSISGAIVTGSGNYSITGGASRHWWAETGGVISAPSLTITLTGTPAFSGAFAFSFMQSTIQCNANTFSGSATGVRYDCSLNSTLYVGGGGATYLPGNAAGSTATGGQYL